MLYRQCEFEHLLLEFQGMSYSRLLQFPHDLDAWS